MRVRAKVSFTGRTPDGVRHHHVAGDEFDLPQGVDWLRAGYVERVAAKVQAKPTRKRKSAKIQSE